jgi:outer membrane lipoprotein-sorting protein
MKNVLLLLCLVFLSGCFQAMAFLGPAITGASTGKIYQAGLSYGTNIIMEQATGKTTSEHMLNILNSNETKLLKK